MLKFTYKIKKSSLTIKFSKLNEDDLNMEMFLFIFLPFKICFPNNLANFKFPKCALVGETHHLMYPISTIINYLKNEYVDPILTL